MVDKYYIYLLINPIDFLPFYVGKGSGNRAYSHLSRSHNDKNVAAISALRAIELDPIIAIIEKDLTEEEAFISEKVWISLFGRKGRDENPAYTGYPLLNNKSTGGGRKSKPANFKWYHSPITHDAVQVKIDEQPPVGYIRGRAPLSEKQKERLSIKMKGYGRKSFIDKEILEELYLIKRMCMRDIAKELRVGLERLTNSLNHWGFVRYKNQYI